MNHWLLSLLCILVCCRASLAGSNLSIPHERLTNPDVTVYRRSQTVLWVYNSRPELGVGAHALDDHSIQMMRAANLRLVRITMYWNQVENTATPVKYDTNAMVRWDDLVARCDTVNSLEPTVIRPKPE